MTYHVQILLLVRQPLFDRATLLLTQTSWELPPLSVGKMTLRLYGALNYSHGLSKGPSFGTGRDGNLVSSIGGVTTYDATLTMLQQIAGPELANQVAEALYYFPWLEHGTAGETR